MYYFHIRVGEFVLEEPVGRELADPCAAVAACIGAIRRIIEDRSEHGHYPRGEAFEIWSETERLAIVPFIDLPAMAADASSACPCKIYLATPCVKAEPAGCDDRTDIQVT